MNKSWGKILMKVFIISSAITLFLCVIIAITGVTMYNTFIYHEPAKEVASQKEVVVVKKEEQTETTKVLDETINQTVAIFGTDKHGTLTDVILVANFNSDTNEIKVISIPRDTYVAWSEEQRAVLPSRNNWVTESKINEMTSWGGMDNIRSLTINQIEKILGMKIDHHVIVSLDAFQKIVDAVGGVDLEVPHDMHYVDTYQDLYIDLKAGYQHLDGDKAEQFVRFRRYRDGDLGRIKAQQLFLEAFADKVLSPMIIIKIPIIATTLFTSVKTDIKLTELGIYYPYIQELDGNKISFYSVEGEARMQNGLSYFFVNQEATDELIEQLFFQ